MVVPPELVGSRGAAAGPGVTPTRAPVSTKYRAAGWRGQPRIARSHWKWRCDADVAAIVQSGLQSLPVFPEDTHAAAQVHHRARNPGGWHVRARPAPGGCRQIERSAAPT